MRVDEIYAVADAGRAVGDLRETRKAGFFLALEVERAVVGRDDLDESVADGVPHDLVIFFVAQRRRHYPLGGLEAVAVVEFVRQKKVLRAGFREYDLLVGHSDLDFVERLFAAGVHYVKRDAGHSGEHGAAVNGFAFRHGRVRRFVVFGAGFSFGREFIGQIRQHFAVFGMDRYKRAVFFGEIESPDELAVSDHQRAFISQEAFETGDAVFYHGRYFGCDALVVFDDRYMKAVIDGRFSFGLFMPYFNGFAERLAFSGYREIDERRRSAACRRDSAGFEIVRRDGAHERHVKVRVHVDGAGINFKA